ncbi:hypothetical protein NTG1052_330011 [Candidatus Nitrotoga sp. 1052]|nr:hypothetical protein NTG1052_330011 [Candidatus Nitrotoga sp. 1052]
MIIILIHIKIKNEKLIKNHFGVFGQSKIRVTPYKEVSQLPADQQLTDIQQIIIEHNCESYFYMLSITFN